MKAALVTKYGPPEVIALRDVAEPSLGDNDVLIEVRASSVSAGDSRMRAMRVPFGFAWIFRLLMGMFSPRNPVLGAEVSGTIAAVGANVSTWKVGDAVFAMNGMRLGGHAELCAVAADGALARKPSALSFEEAAALSFGGTTALVFLRKAKLQKGERILINGAAGAVGIAAVQLAKYFGAHVTAVCSAAKHELVRSLGADEVIDYHQEDFTQREGQYDVVMEVVGTASVQDCLRALRPTGRLLLITAGLPTLLQTMWINATSKKKVLGGVAVENAEDLRLLAELAEKGLYRPVIDRTYPFEQIAEAHARVDTGHKTGSVVVTMRR